MAEDGISVVGKAGRRPTAHRRVGLQSEPTRAHLPARCRTPACRRPPVCRSARESTILPMSLPQRHARACRRPGREPLAVARASPPPSCSRASRLYPAREPPAAVRASPLQRARAHPSRRCGPAAS
uniref:Uncharacterized protein n=1 Tax=Arundo donax TaxID=35708 RepID=A0A0A9DHP0_ARUDO